MSKLYNTLEKIRQQESGLPGKKAAPKAVKTPGDQFRVGRAVILAVIVSCLVGLAAAGTYYLRDKGLIMAIKSALQTLSQTQPSPVTTASQAPTKTTKPKPPQKVRRTTLDAEQLNALAVQHIKKQDYWQGILYLDQARKQNPQEPAHLLNMAVALSEMGLTFPAKRLLSEARTMAPENQQVLKTIALFTDLGIWEEVPAEKNLPQLNVQ